MMLEWITKYLAGDRTDDLVPSHFGFNVPFATGLAIVLLLVVGAGFAWLYWTNLKALTRPMRIGLVISRTIVVILALFLLMDPSIVAKLIKPGEQLVVLLFDDSQSMNIGDDSGNTRGENLIQTYEAAQETFENALARKNQLVRYRVGENIEPISSIEKLTFTQRESDLIGGVNQAIRDLEGAAISGVVLFSDGVQQSADQNTDLQELTKDIPIYTVGVDVASQWRDIELTYLSVKRTEFDKSPVNLTVGVHSQNLAGRQAHVEVVLGSRTVQRKTITISENGQDHEVKLEFIPDRKDWLQYEARVRLDDEDATLANTGSDDRIKENNIRRFAIDNRDKTYRILYVSARPNWENKFFARAMKEDKQLRLTSLLCISNAEPKFVFRGKKSTMANPLFEGFEQEEDRPRYDEAVFIRIGAEKDELASGYPTTPNDLFKYDLVIFGNIEREFFTNKQLELTRDFVEKRGGAVLFLGGHNAFTEGRFAGTPIESMLPVVMYQDYDSKSEFYVDSEFAVVPTLEGGLAGAWQFDSDENEDMLLWDEMPPLYGLNRFPVVRAGATVMAEVRTEFMPSNEQNAPVFALQRYGEGIAAIFATGDTWQWQLRLEHEDDRHERFWRQIVRNLVYQTLEQGYIRNKQDTYTLDTEAAFEFVIRDAAYDKREGLQSTVEVTTPSGETEVLPVDESIHEFGVYIADYTPAESGLYRLSHLALDENDQVVDRLDEAFLVESDRREFQNAQFNGEFLTAMAQATGGAMFALDDLGALADAIPMPAHQDAEELLLHLWHWPGFYIILVLLMIPEWYFRRKKGQA